MALSQQFLSGVGTAMKDLLLANVASAVAGVSINIFGQTIRPFAFLQNWANDLTDQANAAIANAATAQTAANTAQTSANTAQTTANTANTAASAAMAVATGKPSLSQIPVGSSLWSSINNDEDATFPRSQLSFGSSSGTASGGSSTASPHTHGLSTTPQYQPAGNGGDFLEIGFIRATKTRTYTTVGFITGGSATFAGITGAYIGVFYMDPSTGNLTLLNTTSAATNLASSITTTNTEQRFSLGYTINANQNDVFAVGILQVTSILQTCASVMCTTLTNIAPPTTQYPTTTYCYAGAYTAVPSSIAETSLNFSASNKLPFYVLR